MAAADRDSGVRQGRLDAVLDLDAVRLHPLPLYKVLYERLVEDAGPAEQQVWVRAQSGEHAAWKAANLVHPHGWELVEVIRVR